MYWSASFEDQWKYVNIFLLLLTFMKINQSLKIFDRFSFLVQMIQAVFYDLRNFLYYYIMVITTLGFVLMIILNEPYSEKEFPGPLSFIIMSLRMVWGEGP